MYYLYTMSVRHGLYVEYCSYFKRNGYRNINGERNGYIIRNWNEEWERLYINIATSTYETGSFMSVNKYYLYVNILNYKVHIFYINFTNDYSQD